MTVNELRAFLVEQVALGNGDLPVMLRYTASDYWRTPVAVEVDDVEAGKVVYSDYHDKFKVIDLDDDDNESESGDAKVVVLLQ